MVRFFASKYQAILRKHNIRQSMSKLRNCHDNNFFGRMKTEMFYGHDYEFRSYDELKKPVDDYMIFRTLRTRRETSGN